MTDGKTVANVVDPASRNEVAILADGAALQVNLPTAPWISSWSGIHGLTPIAGGGYLLAGASALATVTPAAELVVADLPAGYVAVAPTSHEGTWLLATAADAELPGALTSQAPYTIYVWRSDGEQMPTKVLDQAVDVAPAANGLALIRRADGSWWMLAEAGTASAVSRPMNHDSAISGDGAWLAVLEYTDAGCRLDTTDPCPVTLRRVDGSGALQQPGPEAGIGFDNEAVGGVLRRRDAANLPWRLLIGPPDAPAVVPLR